MKKSLSFDRFLVGVCLGIACLASTVTAQTVQTIYSFTNSGFSSPRNPGAGLTLIGSDLYGTTIYGGTGGFGVVYKITTTGGMTVLANFGGGNTGAHPVGNLVLGPDGNLYGMTDFSGAGGVGTIFQLTTNGTLTTLYSFSTTDGAYPQAGLTMGPDGCLYGTTSLGGSNNNGTIFKMTLKGVLTTLFSFDALSGTFSTNSTGGEPYAPLTLGPDGNFYGTTLVGGKGYGTVFRLTTNGTLTVLVNFVDSNGSEPQSTLTVGPDSCLYGTTLNGGIYGDEGTVFKITTNGVMSTLVSFNYNTGTAPEAGVTFGPDGNLYGTASSGTGYAGSSTSGTLYRLTTNGVLTTLVSFAGTNGAQPQADLTLGADGNFYGTTYFGGSSDPNAAGEVFRLIVTGHPSISKGTGGAIVLNLPGITGSSNLLWVTTNANLPIAQWQLIATNVATNGLFQFTDTNTAGYPMKFYHFTSQ